MERLVVLPTQLGLYEYMLVAQPDAAVNEKLLAEKQHLVNQRTVNNNNSASHIKVASFLASEPMEETIIRYMQRIISKQQSFEVALNNYSGYPPHTIYLRIQDPQPFKHLANELKAISSYVSSCSCPLPKFISHPHLLVAKQLPDNIYLQTLMDYSKKTFHETFMVDQLVLLRRNNKYETAKPVQVFKLQPVAPKPLSSFYN